jgi:hypothetical protein
MSNPLAIDLFCGLGGWTDGLLAEGYDVVGFDIERHVYGDEKYPAQLVLQDVLTLHGKQFADAALIVASPPCQEYSYMAMPWSKAKEIRRQYLSGERDRALLTALFDACFRIQREACAARGGHIPMVVENVRGAQEWVGRSRWNFGSFHLWGDVPALMPMSSAIKNTGGSWFNIAHNTTSGCGNNPDGRLQRCVCDCGHTDNDHDIGSDAPCSKCSCINPKYAADGIKTSGHLNKRNGHSHTRHLTNPAESGVKAPGMNWSDQTKRGQDFTRIAGAFADGTKCGGSWFHDYAPGVQGPRNHGSGSKARKAASARIAKIPLTLSQHIARTFKPCGVAA